MFCMIIKHKINLLILYRCNWNVSDLYPLVLVALALAWLWNSKQKLCKCLFLFIWFGVIILFGVTALQTKTRTWQPNHVWGYFLNHILNMMGNIHQHTLNNKQNVVNFAQCKSNLIQNKYNYCYLVENQSKK